MKSPCFHVIATRNFQLRQFLRKMGAVAGDPLIKYKKRWLASCPLEPAPLRELEESGDLETARAKLLGLGFREMKGGMIPQMTGAWPGKVETKDAIVKKVL